jgi:hypothetical protein
MTKIKEMTALKGLKISESVVLSIFSLNIKSI